MTEENSFEIMETPQSLLDFFKNSPLQEVDLEIERSQDLPRDLDETR
jgi:hypothetical protein